MAEATATGTDTGTSTDIVRKSMDKKHLALHDPELSSIDVDAAKLAG